MKDLAYECLNEKCNVKFHGVNKDGVCCPLCGSSVIPIGEFEDYFKADIPSYKTLKSASLSSNQTVNERSINEFKNSGMLWLVNNLLHVFGWAIVIEVKEGMPSRMYPARVKYRGFSEKDNDKGYMQVAEYMKENAKELLSEIET